MTFRRLGLPRTAPQTEIVENGVRYTGGRGERPENRLFPGPEVQPAGCGAACAGARRVLDCFTHTGSFASERGQGRRGACPTAVDVSEAAVDMARRIRLSERAVGPDGLRGGQCVRPAAPSVPRRAAKSIDFVILDPPAFTKSRQDSGPGASAGLQGDQPTAP